MRTGIGLLAALAVGSAAAGARAEAIGVIIVATDERDALLADNLTEVAMARLAETPGRTLAGTAELRRRLGAESGREVMSCVERPTCLGRVAVSLGVSRLVTGAIRSEPNRFFLNLALTEVASGRSQGGFFRRFDGQLPALVRAVQEGVDELLDPRRAPGQLRVSSEPGGARVIVDDLMLGTTPLVSGALSPGPHRVRVEADRRFAWKSVVDLVPGGDLHLKLGERELPPRRLWPPYLAYGSAAGGVLSAGAGAVLGILSEVPPQGASREDAQMDLGRRTTYGRLGTGLLVGGAVLGMMSAVVFWRYWRDIVAD
jgi:hypothetical protein